MTVGLDCQRCGACCVNLPANRATGVVYWVEIAPGDRLLTRPDLVRKHVVRDGSGTAHLRMAHDGRCLALRGTLDVEVECGIYHARPGPCRRVQPGDDSCLRSRRAHGLEPNG